MQNIKIKWLKRIAPVGIEAGKIETVTIPKGAEPGAKAIENALYQKYHTQMSNDADFTWCREC